MDKKERKTVLGYWHPKERGSIWVCDVAPGPVSDDGNFYICMPTRFAKEFFDTVAGMSRACLIEKFGDAETAVWLEKNALRLSAMAPEEIP